MAGSYAIGLIACGVASIFFGTMFVPLAFFDTQDGVFAQWMMCMSIFFVGLIVQAVRNFPPFYPLAMLGGFLWATGNVTAVPIVNEIGMGIGILLWGFTNLLFGWASGKFGWFGLHKDGDKSDLLNYLGLVLSIISTIMFAFVKSSKGKRSRRRRSEEERDQLNDDQSTDQSSENDVTFGDDNQSSLAPGEPYVQFSTWRSLFSGVRSDGQPTFFTREGLRQGLKSNLRRIIACGVALLAGVFYGLTFTPVIYIQNNYAGASQHGLDYVFAHFCGILATSTAYMIIYGAYKQNKPFVNPNTILPGLISGILWGVAQVAWFVANDILEEDVTFPILARFPGIIAAGWGVFFFKEIQGKRNLWILAISIIVTVIGGILSALSAKIST